MRDRFSGAAEAFARRNSGHHGDHSRHRSSDDVPSSKDVVPLQAIIIFIFCFSQQTWVLLLFLRIGFLYYSAASFSFTKMSCFLSHSPLQQPDSERGRSSYRNGSISKRPALSSSRPSSSGEPSEIRSSRLVSSSSRLSAGQRVQPGFESKTTTFTRSSTTKGGRDDTLRSFELLSIGTGKRKWKRNRSIWVTSDRLSGQHNTLWILCKMPQLYGVCYNTIEHVYVVLIVSWFGSSILQNLMKFPPKTLLETKPPWIFLITMVLVLF